MISPAAIGPPRKLAAFKIPFAASAGRSAACVTVYVWSNTFNVPVRALPVRFGIARKSTDPDPFTADQASTNSQGSAEAGSHEQPGVPFTVNRPVLVPAAKVELAGAKVTAQVPPVCVKVKVRLPIRIVPVRVPAVAFAPTVYPIVPSPTPLAPFTIPIQPVDDCAVQAHVVVTAIDPVEAFEATCTLVGLIPNSQFAPVCVTTNCRFPIVIVPCLLPGVVFAATRNEIVPSALPAAAEVKLIQGTLDAPCQLQPLAACTFTEESPPPAAAS